MHFSRKLVCPRRISSQPDGAPRSTVQSRTVWLLLLVGLLPWSVVGSSLVAAEAPATPALQATRVNSSVDAEPQDIRYLAPDRARSLATPLLVSLHTWSADVTQDRSEWVREAVAREWIYIQPDFRGANDHPEACGSSLARQDILDAIDWACREFQVDKDRIYLAGVSGGGHMTMVMAAYHPERFSAASAWVGPTDLAEWYRFHSQNGQPGKYARMIADCCGGAPGASPEVDAQYRARSPVFHLGRVGDLPLDLHAGVRDGVTGSVPIHHTLRAYNAVAKARGAKTISESVMDELWRYGRLRVREASDLEPDPTYGREILLRRVAGNARVTIFDGTHEALPSAACEWLAQQQRTTKP